MYITIYDNETIGTIRKKFSEKFPFLRIDFFRAIASEVPYSALRVADEDVELGSLRHLHNSGAIRIEPSMTTREAEERFLKEFGLHVQVFRKSGDKWLLTTSTDGYTLEKQNTIGEEMAKHAESEEPADIHEQE